MKRLAERRPDIAFYVKVFAIISRNPTAAKNIVCTGSMAVLEDAFERKPVPDGDCTTTEIDDNQRFARENRINSAPTLILPDGTIQPGFYTAEQLEERIDRSAQSSIFLR